MTYEKLKEFGTLIDTTCEGTAQLWAFEDGVEYVVLCDNTVITRIEDNQISDAFFPFD